VAVAVEVTKVTVATAAVAVDMVGCC
jgi:hypothetical protein